MGIWIVNIESLKEVVCVFMPLAPWSGLSNVVT